MVTLIATVTPAVSWGYPSRRDNYFPCNRHQLGTTRLRGTTFARYLSQNLNCIQKKVDKLDAKYLINFK